MSLVLILKTSIDSIFNFPKHWHRNFLCTCTLNLPGMPYAVQYFVQIWQVLLELVYIHKYIKIQLRYRLSSHYVQSRGVFLGDILTNMSLIRNKLCFFRYMHELSFPILSILLQVALYQANQPT